jgi:hypothetical protein
VARDDPARHDVVRPRYATLSDGTIPEKQRPEADVNIEYQTNAKLADAAMILAHKFQLANDKYASNYPATVGPHMTNTDSTPFMDLTPAISLREAERGAQLGQGWNPQHISPLIFIRPIATKTSSSV